MYLICIPLKKYLVHKALKMAVFWGIRHVLPEKLASTRGYTNGANKTYMTNNFFCQHGAHVLAIWPYVLAKVVHIDLFCKILRACVLAI